MYNILIAAVATALTFGLVAVWIGSLAAILPAILVGGTVLFLLTRRISQQVEAEMAGVMPLLQARRVQEATEHIRRIQDKYGKWQILLEGQLEAQLGMIDYLQMNYDAALPKLERGKYQNWTALTAIGCIHYRKGRKEPAWEALEAAANAAPKEVIIYLIHATLKVRSQARPEALEVLAGALKNLPDNELIKNLQRRIANKKKVDTKQFPQLWLQFFPEEMARDMMMRGRKGPLPANQRAPQQRIGASKAPRR